MHRRLQPQLGFWFPQLHWYQPCQLCFLSSLNHRGIKMDWYVNYFVRRKSFSGCFLGLPFISTNTVSPAQSIKNRHDELCKQNTIEPETKLLFCLFLCCFVLICFSSLVFSHLLIYLLSPWTLEKIRGFCWLMNNCFPLQHHQNSSTFHIFSCRELACIFFLSLLKKNEFKNSMLCYFIIHRLRTL